MRARSLPLVAATLIALPLAGCYSERDFGRQLDKYNALVAQHNEQQAQLAQVNRDLAAERRYVEGLEGKLRELGVDFEETSKRLSNVSASLEERERTLEQRERALAEYQTRAKQLEQVRARFALLRKKLDELAKLGLEVSIRRNHVVLSLPGDTLFEGGRETLKRDGQDILHKIAAVIATDPMLSERSYQIVGHLDARPGKQAAPREAWTLSLGRAREVLLFLVSDKRGKLPAKQWSAAAYAELDPVAPNDTEEGRQKNRRCELVLMPTPDEALDLKAILQAVSTPAAPPAPAPSPPAAPPPATPTPSPPATPPTTAPSPALTAPRANGPTTSSPDTATP